jgi:hypothetical protein
VAQGGGVSLGRAAARQQSFQHPDPDPPQQSRRHHRQCQHSKALKLFFVHRPHFVRAGSPPAAAGSGGVLAGHCRLSRGRCTRCSVLGTFLGTSLEGQSVKSQSGRQDSNLRPSAPKALFGPRASQAFSVIPMSLAETVWPCQGK